MYDRPNLGIRSIIVWTSVMGGVDTEVQNNALIWPWKSRYGETRDAVG